MGGDFVLGISLDYFGSLRLQKVDKRKAPTHLPRLFTELLKLIT